MHASDKSTKPSVADSKYRWHKVGYLPIAFAVAGCVAAIAIAFEAKELSNQRLELDRSRPTREKIMVGSSLMQHALVDLHRELGSIETIEKEHQRLLSLDQHEIEKVQKDKADVTQKIEKFVKEEAMGDFDRAAKKRIEAVRDQTENGPKSLATPNDRFTRGQVKLASLIDQRAKLKTALPQMTIDETRLQGAAKRLEDEIRSATKRRDAVASEISRAEDQLHQLQQDRVSEDQLHQLQQDRVKQTIGRDRYKGLADDLRKQSEHFRKNVAELERKHATLVLPTRVSAAVPLVDQSNQEERREAELRSQDAQLETRRIELEQNIKALQQQKEELVKTNKSFQDQLDAAAANLSSIMEQAKTLEPDRREATALQAQLEELNRQIDDRRKMIDHLAKPAPRSRHVRPVPLGATDQAPRGVR
jgi:chromosome segregation ATPase